MSNPVADVLVCGAGPVGLTLAAQLSCGGSSVRVIDRRSQATEDSRALVVWARSLELLALGMDVTPLLEQGRSVSRAEFRVGSQRIADVNFSATHSRYGAGTMIPQSATERILERHLESAGIRVERQRELIDFEQLSDCVRCRIRTPSGEVETVDAAHLVGCDGAHSTVRNHLGLPFTGHMDMHRWVLADAALEGPRGSGPPDLPTADITVCWHKAGTLVLFRIDDSTWRVVAETPLDDPQAPRRDPTLEEMQTLLDERGPGGLSLRDPLWMTEFRIHERKVDQFRVGRVFLAGDAAHVHSPAGGQGMNTGIQDACNLAWKMGLVRKGLASEMLLDSYTMERRAIAEQILGRTTRVTNLATLKNPVLQQIRNTVAKVALHFQWAQDMASDTLSELTLRYNDSPISGEDQRSGSVAVYCGERVPDIELGARENLPRTLYEVLRQGRPTVVSWGGPENWAERARAHLPAPWQSEIQWVALAVGAVDQAHLIGLDEPGYIVIRPDAYLAAAGRLEDSNPLVNWCRRLAGALPLPSATPPEQWTPTTLLRY